MTRSAGNVVDQLIDFGYDPLDRRDVRSADLGWRAMHSQGRGLFSVLLKYLPDIDQRTVREGEVVCNTLVGFNFGDGHLHNEDLIERRSGRGPVRARRAHGGRGSSRSRSTAGSSTTR